MRFLNCPVISASLFTPATYLPGTEFTDGDHREYLITFYRIDGDVYRCQYHRGTTITEVSRIHDVEAIGRLLAAHA